MSRSGTIPIRVEGWTWFALTSPLWRRSDRVPETQTAHEDGRRLPLTAERDVFACGCGRCPVTNVLERGRADRWSAGTHVSVLSN